MPTALLALLFLFACTDKTGGDSAAADSGGETADDSGDPGTPAALTPCPTAVGLETTGQVADPALTEASGLVWGARPETLWSHNDSGGGPRLYAFGPDGAALGTVELDDVVALDWEDLAWARDADGEGMLLVGDIGDNAQARAALWVHVLAEPDPAAGSTPVIQTLELTYEDGPRDAEGLLVDPVDGTLYVVSKEATDAGLYRLPAPWASGVLERVATLDLASAGATVTLVTAADTSPDGGCVYLRTYTDVLAWDRPAGTTLAEAMAGMPTVFAPAAEPQGEAIAATSTGFWTLSEGDLQPIYAAEATP